MVSGCVFVKVILRLGSVSVSWRRVPAGGSWPDFMLTSVTKYRNFYKMTNKMQLCRIIYCSFTALHVSSDIFAHHQEHRNCIYSFWFHSRMSSVAVMAEYELTNMKLCRIIYCSLTALHVSSGIFAHHREHLNCIYSFWFYSRVSL
jgi:hypothetical protein